VQPSNHFLRFDAGPNTRTVVSLLYIYGLKFTAILTLIRSFPFSTKAIIKTVTKRSESRNENLDTNYGYVT